MWYYSSQFKVNNKKEDLKISYGYSFFHINNTGFFYYPGYGRIS